MGRGKLSACKTIFLFHSAATSSAIHPGRLFGRTSMNIAILHYSVPPVVGGVESVIAHHARLIAANGYSVRLIAGRGEALGEKIPLVTIPLADSQHPRVLVVKEQLDQGMVNAEFDSLR